MSDAISKYLESVECHFKWKPAEEYEHLEELKRLEEKLLFKVQHDPKIKVFTFTFLTYIFTIGARKGKEIDFDKAKDYARKAVEACECVGEEMVALGNMMHLKKKTRESSEMEKLCNKIEDCKKRFDTKDHCRIKLINASALWHFNVPAYKKAVEIYKEVLEIDNTNPNAHFGLGKMLGRIRRHDKGTRSKPSDEEVNALHQAHTLCNESDIYAAQYGFARVQCLTSECRLEEAKDIINIFAKVLSQNEEIASNSVYKWCGKGLKELAMKRKWEKWEIEIYFHCVEQQKKCNDAAVRHYPTDTSLLHLAGIFYRNCNEYVDLDKAIEYFQMAKDNCPMGNFWADVDLESTRKKKDKQYDMIEPLVQLLEKYCADDRRLEQAYLHEMMGDALFEKGQKEDAKRDYLHAVELDPEATRCRKAKTCLIEILEKELKSETTTALKLQVLHQLGDVLYITRDYKGAIKHYKEKVCLASQDVPHPTETDEACKKICEIHYKLEDYKACIDSGLDKCQAFPCLKEFMAKSYYMVAQNLKSSDRQDYKENLLQSAELGLVDAGRDLLTFTKDECMNNENLCLTKAFYEDMARLHFWFSAEGGQYWSLEDAEILEVAKTIAKDARKLVLSQPGANQITQIHNRKLKKTRKVRFEMARKKVGKGKNRCWDVLVEARCQLDGCFFRFKKSHPEFSRVNKRGYYPFTPKAKTGIPSESPQDLANTETFLKKKLEEDMKLEQFSSKVPDLFDFLCRHQAYYSTKFNFVPEFANLVNKKKHEDQDEETDENYELAHSACIYVEELAIELSRHTQTVS